MLLKRFPVSSSVIFVLFLSMLLSFVAFADSTEPESFSSVESTSFVEETTAESTSEVVSESSTISGSFDEQETIINRLELIYTLGLFVVGVLAALLVLFILWHVLDVFLFSS